MVALGLTIYLSLSESASDLHHNSRRYRNIVFIYPCCPFFGVIFVIHIQLYMLLSPKYIVIIIAIYKSMSFKKDDRRKDYKCIFIMFVKLNFLFTFFWFSYLFLWIHITVWWHFSFKCNFASTHFLYAVLPTILHFYMLFWPKNTIIFILFYTIILKSVIKGVFMIT